MPGLASLELALNTPFPGNLENSSWTDESFCDLFGSIKHAASQSFRTEFTEMVQLGGTAHDPKTSIFRDCVGRFLSDTQCRCAPVFNHSRLAP